MQGKQELKDFNIANEAGGVGKNITKTISTIVSNNSLEIRFYWAGKGTTDIPHKSVYGPLISAIFVTRGESLCLSLFFQFYIFKVSNDMYSLVLLSVNTTNREDSGSMAIGVVIGITVAAIVFVILIVLGWRLHTGKRNSLAKGDSIDGEIYVSILFFSPRFQINFYISFP